MFKNVLYFSWFGIFRWKRKPNVNVFCKKIISWKRDFRAWYHWNCFHCNSWSISCPVITVLSVITVMQWPALITIVFFHSLWTNSLPADTNAINNDAHELSNVTVYTLIFAANGTRKGKKSFFLTPEQDERHVLMFVFVPYCSRNASSRP